MPVAKRTIAGIQACRQAEHGEGEQRIRARQDRQHHNSSEDPVPTHQSRGEEMENRGFEPLTSAVRSQRSTN